MQLSLFRNKRISVEFLVYIGIGVFVGIILNVILAGVYKEWLTDYLTKILEQLRLGKTIEMSVFGCFLHRCFILVFMGWVATTQYKRMGIRIFFLTNGMVCSFFFWGMLRWYGLKGGGLALLCWFPQGLVTVPMYFGWMYLLWIRHYNTSRKKGVIFKQILIKGIINAGFVMLCLIAGVMEAKQNPAVVERYLYHFFM